MYKFVCKHSVMCEVRTLPMVVTYHSQTPLEPFKTSRVGRIHPIKKAYLPCFRDLFARAQLALLFSCNSCVLKLVFEYLLIHKLSRILHMTTQGTSWPVALGRHSNLRSQTGSFRRRTCVSVVSPLNYTHQ